MPMSHSRWASFRLPSKIIAQVGQHLCPVFSSLHAKVFSPVAPAKQLASHPTLSYLSHIQPPDTHQPRTMKNKRKARKADEASEEAVPPDKKRRNHSQGTDHRNYPANKDTGGEGDPSEGECLSAN